MQKISIILINFLLIFLICSVVSASPRKRFDEATQTCRVFDQNTLRDGFVGFKDNCKKCHFTGNEQGASFLHTESKVMKGWNRVFAKKYPLCAQNGEWDNIEPEQLRRINDYLFRKAANTYDPNDAADCG